MSGIAGTLRFDSEAIERRDLERAANALRAHGPDRRGFLAAGSVGLVHVLMRMVPEDQFDRQPWRAASGAVIGAAVRLDNRDDLLVRLWDSAGRRNDLGGRSRGSHGVGKIRE